ncbi:MAG: hypothetical protein ACFE8B_15620 [Candidatus Hermodarchaeota archaeon]
MYLNKFDDWPSETNMKRLIYLGFIVLMVNYPIIIVLSLISHYPATFMESQLSFSGEVIKSHFSEMNSEQIIYYVFYQISDNVYDFCHICIFFGLSLFLAHKFSSDSRWRKVGYWMAIIGLIGTISDLTENSLIIMMTTDPQGFPNAWAIAHSCLASVKFLMWAIQAVWIIWADVKLFRSKELAKKPALAAIGVVFAQHWTSLLFGLFFIFGVDVTAILQG